MRLIVRHALSSAYRTTWPFYLWIVAAVVGGAGLVIDLLAVHMNPDASHWVAAFPIVVFGFFGPYHLQVRRGLLETARVNGWNFEPEPRKVMPPLPRDSR